MLLTFNFYRCILLASCASHLQPVSSLRWLQDDAAVLSAGNAVGILRIDGSLQDRLNNVNTAYVNVGLGQHLGHSGATGASSLSADLVMFPAWHSVDPLPIASLGMSNLGVSKKKLIWEGQRTSFITSLQLNQANKHIALTGGTDGRVFVTNLSRYTAILASDQPYAVNGMYSAGDVVTDARFFPNNPSAALCAALNGTISVFDVRARPDSVASSFNVHRSGLTGTSFLDDYTVMSCFDDGSVAPLDVRKGLLCSATQDKFMGCASGVHADVNTGVCVTTGDAGLSVWKSKYWTQDNDERTWSLAQRSHHRARAMQAPGSGAADSAASPVGGGYHVAGAFSSVQPGVFLAGDSHGNIIVLDTKSRNQSVRSSIPIAVPRPSVQVATSGAKGPMLVATAKAVMEVQRSELAVTTPATSTLSHSARIQAASSAVKLHRRQQKAVTVKKLAARNSAAIAASRAGIAGTDAQSTLLTESSACEPHTSSDGMVHNVWTALSPAGLADAGFKPGGPVQNEAPAVPNTVIEVKTHVKRQPMTAVSVQNDAFKAAQRPPGDSALPTPGDMPPPSASVALPMRPEQPSGLPFAVFSASAGSLQKPSWFFADSDREFSQPSIDVSARQQFGAGALAAPSSDSVHFNLGSLVDASSHAEHVGDSVHRTLCDRADGSAFTADTPAAASAGKAKRTQSLKEQRQETGTGMPIAAAVSGGALVAPDTAASGLLAAPSAGNMEELFAQGGQLASASVFDRDDGTNHGLGAYSPVMASAGRAAHQVLSASAQSHPGGGSSAHPHEAAVGSSMTSATTSLPTTHAHGSVPPQCSAEGAPSLFSAAGATSGTVSSPHAVKAPATRSAMRSASPATGKEPDRGQKRLRSMHGAMPQSAADASGPGGETKSEVQPALQKRPRRMLRSSRGIK